MDRERLGRIALSKAERSRPMNRARIVVSSISLAALGFGGPGHAERSGRDR